MGRLMENPLRPRLLGIAGIAVNLALLGYFKYAGFILGSLGTLVDTTPLANIILPLGISFFTFQQIAYLVDLMRGAPVERDIVSYTLFVSFFPHLIAGPLVHHAEMIPQFKRNRTVRSPVLFARGLAMFAAGLFKKVVIADCLAQFSTPVFAHLDGGGSVTMSWAWLAAMAYTLQIYFDFSGYSDMALGLGLLFGIRLPVNFRSPYKAQSIIDFWRRWHITLSRFLREYLYIPLGGNRRGPARRYVNLLVTMLLGGLWHGAGWNFVIWGGLHGGCLAVNHLWRGWRAEKAPETICRLKAAASKVLCWLTTFLVVVLAWVFFRAVTLAGAWQMLRGLFGSVPDSTPFRSPGILRVFDLPLLIGDETLLQVGAVGAALALVVALTMPNVPQIFGYREYRSAPERVSWIKWRPNFAWALLVATAATLSLFGMWHQLEFLYFQF